ncbi:MAG TPA: LysR family transcriptional regulator [Noviherbaspirillum sp.]
MDLRDLRYFEVIAELEHMGRASERLHRTQPALTSSIRRLEQDCGVRLFEKSGRGIRLTEAGKVLLKWARRTRLDVHDAQQEINHFANGLLGTVSVGIVPTAAQFLLPPAMRQLIREAPEVQPAHRSRPNRRAQVAVAFWRSGYDDRNGRYGRARLYLGISG